MMTRERPTNDECKQALARLRDEVGEIKYRRFLPRRIASPSTHCSHALYRLGLLSCAISHEQRPGYIGAQVAGQTALESIKYNLPAWYVGEELTEALTRTVPPSDLVPEDINWPLPSLTFFLPESEKVKQLFGGRQPLWLTGCLAEPQPHWTEKDGRPVSSRTLIHIVCHLPTEGLTEYHSILRNNQPLKEWAEFPFTLDHRTCVDTVDYLKESEHRFAQQMTYLFLSMVMLLGQERPAPDFIEAGAPTPAKGRPLPTDPTRVEDFDRVWMPSWLGRHWRIKKPAIIVGPHGTHASPILHWRKGHMHTYLVGTGRTEKKIRWVEPVMINAPKDQP